MMCFKDFIEQKGSKALFTFFIAQTLVFVTCAVVCILSQDKNEDEALRQNIFKWAILFELYIVQLYYSYHAVYKQNVVELFTMLVISISCTFCGGYRFIAVFIDDYSVASQVFALIQIITELLLQVFFCIASYYLWDIFKWKIYKKIGGNHIVQELFKNYERFKAFVKLFCILAFTLLVSYLIFLQKFSAVHVIVDICLILLDLGVFFTGYSGVRKENKKLMISYFVLSGLLYTISMFAFAILIFKPNWADLGQLYQLDINSQIILLGLVLCYTAVFICMTIFSIKALKGFNQGLKDKLQQKNQEGKSSLLKETEDYE